MRSCCQCRAQVNLGGLLAWEFLLMHWVEVRRWQDIRKKDSVNEVLPLFWHAVTVTKLRAYM